MKKTLLTVISVISVILVTVMLGSSLLCFAEADTEEKAYAYVSIYDGESIVLAMYEVEEKDEDGDGLWTINDVLISAHNDKCEDGFAAVDSDYGPFITKLWGIENGGAYGYYKNNVMSYGLTEEVAQGDVIYAFVYSDTATYSDAYSFFDSVMADTEDGKVSISLKYVSGFDPETYAPIESPLAGAVITLNGIETEFVTDEEGKAEIELPDETTLISAKKDGLLLIPPVCLAKVNSFAYINIYDGESIVLAMHPVEKKDEDGDGLWTINDVLISVHNERCEGGFATVDSDYGPYITKLWGIENGGAYGYYNNNLLCMGVTEEVMQGDVIYAYVYSDDVTYSDVYSFFDTYMTEDEDGKTELTLKYVSFDPETYDPVDMPLEGAVITFDGEKTDFITDADGKAVITLPGKSVMISAEKDGFVIIPPVCLFITETKPGDANEDGQINNKDVTDLFGYVSGAEKEENEARYDFNGDGEVNNKDVVDLFRAVSVL